MTASLKSGPKLLAVVAALLLATAAAAQQTGAPASPAAPAAAPGAITPPAPAEAAAVPEAPAAIAPPAAQATPDTAPVAPSAAPTAPVSDNTGPGPRIINQTPAAAEPAVPAAAPSVQSADTPAVIDDAAPTTGDAPEAVRPSSPVDRDQTAPVAKATLPHDLTPYGMFMAADYIVKSVMIGLAFASLVTWTIWLAKGIELMTSRAKAQRGVRRLERADSLQEVVAGGQGSKWPRRGPVAALVAAALREEERSTDLTIDGIKERTQIALHRIEARAGRSMQRGTGLLATIGSTAPFVGLFGTVWGIMNAFIGISKANTTNLAVVAPGIAEALLATAIGLVAAIPAVIIYNVFARAIAGYRAVLADASAEVLRHLSRDLDRRESGAVRNAAAGAKAPQRLAAE